MTTTPSPPTHPPNHASTLRAVGRFRRIWALWTANVPIIEIARLERVSRQRALTLVKAAIRAKGRSYF